ncbi:hypothetical protein RB195_017569 [Necator americanus]|uniref:PLAT domain-containing protein n=1 Tax=Necator americanus TaxID=51031 RepID=A0ABR1C5T7_NECAM
MGPDTWAVHISIFVIVVVLALKFAAATNMTLPKDYNSVSADDIAVMAPASWENITISATTILKVTIRDAECYSANTTSQFVVYLAAIDQSNIFYASVVLHRSVFSYNKRTNSYFYQATTRDPTLICIAEGEIHCIPRADAIFIRFDNEPNDPWAIDQIDVDYVLKFGHEDEYTHMFHTEHAVLLPCKSWLKDARMYQIGPRNGLFIEHPYDYFPSGLIRDWV